MNREELEELNVDELVNDAQDKFQPRVSRAAYNKAYNNYLEWRNKKGISDNSESTLLAYFNYLSKIYAPTSVWSKHSMIKSKLIIEDNVDINKFARLHLFMKKISDGYEPKKSEVFTSEQIDTFLSTASDHDYLLHKVIAVLGISGACRGVETYNIKLNQMEKHGDMYKIKIPKTKNKHPKSFIIDTEFTDCIEKYMAYRPSEYDSDKFLFAYNKGEARRLPVGKNKIAQVPKDMAKFLGLKNYKMYTGHAFRRTSATLLSNSGATMQSIQDHGGWKSLTVAKAYCADSDAEKIKRAKAISKQMTSNAKKQDLTPLANSNVNLGASTSNANNNMGASTSNNIAIDDFQVPDDLSQKFFEDFVPDKENGNSFKNDMKNVNNVNYHQCTINIYKN